MAKSSRKYAERETTLSACVGELQSLRDEMSEMRDNLEEKLSGTNKYQMASDASDALDAADDEPDCPDFITDLTVKYTEVLPRGKMKPLSRADRHSNAMAMLHASHDAVSSWLENDNTKPDEDDKRDDAESYQSDIQTMIDAMDGVEFPGMFAG